jgi:hypothetical protein
MELHIPKPCLEDWSAMQPAEKGRHCASCQKTVIDFTQMSDAEIVRYMSRAGSSICGRFLPDQLSRKLEDPIAPKRSRWPGWQLVFTSVLLTTTSPVRPVRPVREVLHQMSTSGQQPVDSLVADTSKPMILGEIADPLPAIVQDTPKQHRVLMGDTVDVSDIKGDIAVAPVDDTAPRPPDTSRPILPVKCVEAFVGKVAVRRKPVTTVVDPVRRVLVDTAIRLKLLPPKMDSRPGLSVYPNPVNRGELFHIVLPVETGTFAASLYSVGGAMVQERVIEVNGPEQVHEWSLPTGLTPGVYVLRVVGKGGSYVDKVVLR